MFKKPWNGSKSVFKNLSACSFFCLLLATLANAASARPAYLDTMVKTFPQQAASIEQRSCTNCHNSPSDFSRNEYGKRLELLIAKSGGQDPTPAMLKEAQSIGSPAEQSRRAQQKPTTHASLIPANCEHPALVHFPIALFICGMFLDILGFIRKDKSMFLAGWYNLVLAAVSSLAALATGLGALLFMHIAASGLIRRHLSLAILSTILLWVLAGLRFKRHETLSRSGRAAYYLLAAANLIIIAAVGHLGGKFVYGS
jgi:uncharacterized membrane protein